MPSPGPASAYAAAARSHTTHHPSPPPTYQARAVSYQAVPGDEGRPEASEWPAALTAPEPPRGAHAASFSLAPRRPPR